MVNGPSPRDFLPTASFGIRGLGELRMAAHRGRALSNESVLLLSGWMKCKQTRNPFWGDWLKSL